MQSTIKHAVLAILASASLAAGTLGVGSAAAADKVKVAGSQKGFWDTTLFVYGDQSQGFFKKAGIDVEVLWTSGGADCENPVISGSLDMCLATGVLGAITAWAKGAPIAVVAAEMTGSPDIWWYVRADSPIKSIKDAAGKTLTYSRPGSSSHSLITAIAKAAGVPAKIVGSGGPAATLTQVMSGQIDVGWTAGLMGADLVKQGKIRKVISGNEAPGVANQTVRVHIVNTNFLKARTDVVKRFLAAYKQSIDWGYSDPKALEMWAQDNKAEPDLARSVRDEMFPKSALAMKPVMGLELSLRQAVDDKRIAKPFTPEQVRDFLRYVNELAP